MPAPTQAQLQPFVAGLMQQNELRGQGAPALAGAIADLIAQALNLLATQAKVVPGIPCSTSATVGPGSLK